MAASVLMMGRVLNEREGAEPGGRKPLSDHMLEWKKGGVSGRKEEDRKRRRGEYDVKRVYSERTTAAHTHNRACI